MPLPNNSVDPSARLAERSKPESTVVMHQHWRDLLFLHWPMAPEILSPTLPDGLRLDFHKGHAWVGIVPFHMKAVRPRGLPPLPYVSSFPELNLRTYVVDSAGRPGVWFYSLDTPKPLANWIARTFFHLNYRYARLEHRRLEDLSHEYRVSSKDREQLFHWQVDPAPFHAKPGSLEFFLAERYRLYAYDSRKQQLWTGKVHHTPYPLQRVEVPDYSTQLFTSNALPEPQVPPASALFSPGVDVKIYPLERV